MSEATFLISKVRNRIDYGVVSADGLPDDDIPREWLCFEGVAEAMRWPADEPTPESVRISIRDRRPNPSRGWFRLWIDWNARRVHARHFSADLFSEHIDVLLKVLGNHSASCWMRIEAADEEKEKEA